MLLKECAKRALRGVGVGVGSGLATRMAARAAFDELANIPQNFEEGEGGDYDDGGGGEDADFRWDENDDE